MDLAGGFKNDGPPAHRHLPEAGIRIVEELDLSLEGKRRKMIDKNKELGMIGTGRMGGNLTAQALERGMRVAGLEWMKVPDELLKTPMVVAGRHIELKRELHLTRSVFIHIPAGPAVDVVKAVDRERTEGRAGGYFEEAA